MVWFACVSVCILFLFSLLMQRSLEREVVDIFLSAGCSAGWWDLLRGSRFRSFYGGLRPRGTLAENALPFSSNATRFMSIHDRICRIQRRIQRWNKSLENLRSPRCTLLLRRPKNENTFWVLPRPETLLQRSTWVLSLGIFTWAALVAPDVEAGCCS